MEQQRELLGEFVVELAALVEARRDEIGHPDPDTAIPYAIDLVVAQERARQDELMTKPLFAARSDAAFVTETVRAVCAYLRVDGPSESA